MSERKGLLKERWERTGWFRAARFGMFIHWGLYAIPGRGEWIRNFEEISNEDYEQYFDEFDPTHFDAKEWARMAKEAGMKYAVLTAKHHEGFCLFDSALTDYKSTNTKFGRDIVKEYVEAFRSEGLKVGLYYSLLDWHHPDYPVFGDAHHPLRNKCGGPEIDEGKDWNRYLDYMHGQVRELLTNYGMIDIIWFDFSYDDMTKEKWGATRLIKMARELQPDILIDNRLGGDIESETDITAGDFTTPEQIIPEHGIVDREGNPLPWETCITHNGSWGYDINNQFFKSPRRVIHGLVECVSKNGNMLLNIGPDARGRFPDQSRKMLKEIGEWMSVNGESIYGCGSSEFNYQPWGRFTQNGNRLYAHIYDMPMGSFYLSDLKDRIDHINLLSTGTRLRPLQHYYIHKMPNVCFVDLPWQELPDDKDTVLEIVLKK